MPLSLGRVVSALKDGRGRSETMEVEVNDGVRNQLHSETGMARLSPTSI